jgi:hypothetical protein
MGSLTFFLGELVQQARFADAHVTDDDVLENVLIREGSHLSLSLASVAAPATTLQSERVRVRVYAPPPKAFNEGGHDISWARAQIREIVSDFREPDLAGGFQVLVYFGEKDRGGQYTRVALCPGRFFL